MFAAPYAANGDAEQDRRERQGGAEEHDERIQRSMIQQFGDTAIVGDDGDEGQQRKTRGASHEMAFHFVNHGVRVFAGRSTIHLAPTSPAGASSEALCRQRAGMSE